MGKEIVIQVQELQRVPHRINPRRNTPRHILIKLSKTEFKEKILKATREMQQIATQVQEVQRVPYRINPRRNTPRHIVIKVDRKSVV